MPSGSRVSSHEVRSWWLFPPGTPRFGLSDSSRRTLRAGTDFYRPSSFRGQAGRFSLRCGLWVFGSKALCRLGNRDPTFDVEIAPVLDRLAEMLGPKIEFAAWLGAPGQERKFTVGAFARGSGRALAFAKVSTISGRGSRGAVQRETAVLQALRDTDLAGIGPNVLAAGEFDGVQILVTEPIPGRPLPSNAPPDEARIELSRALADLPLSVLGEPRTVAGYVNHGDFVPWNCVVSNDGSLRLIDWEFASVRPLGWDLCHHEVQRHCLFGRLNADRAAIEISHTVPSLVERAFRGTLGAAALMHYCQKSLDFGYVRALSRSRDIRIKVIERVGTQIQ